MLFYSKPFIFINWGSATSGFWIASGLWSCCSSSAPQPYWTTLYSEVNPGWRTLLAHPWLGASCQAVSPLLAECWTKLNCLEPSELPSSHGFWSLLLCIYLSNWHWLFRDIQLNKECLGTTTQKRQYSCRIAADSWEPVRQPSLPYTLAFFAKRAI